MTLPIALTVAGSDSSGGAGIQADLRSFALFGVHGVSVITAVTAQNTLGVTRSESLSLPIIEAQFLALFRDLRITSAKTGMLGGPPVIELVYTILRRYQPPWLVVDPVLVAHSGERLVPGESLPYLLSLMRIANLSTPNLLEAQELLEEEINPQPSELERAAIKLVKLLKRPVLLKGGHSGGDHSSDLFVSESLEILWMRSPRIKVRDTHGTGCHLSAAITALLALGYPLTEAILRAKRWLTLALKRAEPVGKGAIPPFPVRYCSRGRRELL